MNFDSSLGSQQMPAQIHHQANEQDLVDDEGGITRHPEMVSLI